MPKTTTINLPSAIGPLYMPAALIPAEIRGDEQSFRIEAAANDSVELDLYDIVWPWEARRLAAELPAKAKEIRLKINSPGGDMFAGVTMYNLLKRHPARVVVEVDGLAASAATLPAMAGDEVRVNRSAFLMIHNPHVVAVGAEAKDLRELADTLEKMEDGLASIYAEKTGKPVETIKELMAATTWYTGEEAVKSGFADKAADRPTVKADWDLSVYGEVPEPLRAQHPEPQAPAAEPETVRQLEAHVREEFSLSQSAAKAFVALAARVLRPREESAPPPPAPNPRDEEEEAAVLFRSVLTRGRAFANT